MAEVMVQHFQDQVMKDAVASLWCSLNLSLEALQGYPHGRNETFLHNLELGSGQPLPQ